VLWSRTDLAVDLEYGRAGLPESTPLEKKCSFLLCYCIDEAFPLKLYLMRLFLRRMDRMTDKERIFTYRLSRAKLSIENAFGILASWWRILHRRLCCSVENAQRICKALVCLHNFTIIDNNRSGQYCPPDWLDVDEEILVEGQWYDIEAGQYFKELSREESNRAGAISIGLQLPKRLFYVTHWQCSSTLAISQSIEGIQY